MTKSMLKKDAGTRESMLDWLAAAVEVNSNRAKEYANHQLDSSDNFMINLAYVMLKICDPFLKPGSKIKATIQSEYCVRGARFIEPESKSKCTYDEETKFAVTSGDVDAWVDKRNLARVKLFNSTKGATATAASGATGATEGYDDGDLYGDSDDSDDAMDMLLQEEGAEPAAEPARESDPFTFSTECFFITARALHHGLIPSMKTSRNSNFSGGVCTQQPCSSASLPALPVSCTFQLRTIAYSSLTAAGL